MLATNPDLEANLQDIGYLLGWVIVERPVCVITQVLIRYLIGKGYGASEKRKLTIVRLTPRGSVWRYVAAM